MHTQTDVDRARTGGDDGTMPDLLRRQTELTERDRQSIVLLRFADPVPRVGVWQFMRIRLSVEMFDDGEEKFFRAKQVQPHRVGPRRCKACGAMREEIDDRVQVCRREQCRAFQVLIECGPLRGVIKLLIASDFEEPDRRLNRVGLVLDRRYNEPTMKNVFRLAGQICDEMGWVLA